MKWKHTNSPTKRKFKALTSVGDVTFTVFWVSERTVLMHNNIKYCDMPCNKQIPAGAHFQQTQFYSMKIIIPKLPL